MNVAVFIVAAMNIPQIIECSSPESATFDILFYFALGLALCSQILLRHVTAHDETFGICPFLEVTLSGRPDLSRTVSPYLTDCAVPLRRISS